MIFSFDDAGKGHCRADRRSSGGRRRRLAGGCDLSAVKRAVVVKAQVPAPRFTKPGIKSPADSVGDHGMGRVFTQPGP
jgi:hypothetical protein